ncbi:Peptide chain release factor 1 [hydrothermal vent metagenome]|uniref:Peptide chain release factor 1 n=1 Tax=hydrothermal vent metagenome TaxID=652676 RepID=A0A3B1CPP2_9ZZZZ
MNFLDKLKEVKERFEQINERLSDPAIMSDQVKLIKLSKERSNLLDIVSAYDEYVDVVKNIEGNQEVIDAAEDKELTELAELELEELKARRTELEEKIKLLLIPKDPQDDQDVILEVRAGTGGEEAGLFAGDLLRMYTRFAELKGWNIELMDLNEATMGGIKEAVMAVRGNGIYGMLKYESGVHRVQRVPATEASGRVHTSAASVVVMPEVDDVEVEIDMSDVRVDTYRASGAGGQHVNKTDSAIRMTHIPTGIVVQCQDERSQIKNRQKALKVLKTRLYDAKLHEQESEISEQRKSIVKSGDRSDKIRTYNYPQNRVTDHRIGLTLYNLTSIMEGNLQELIEKLQMADRTEKLKNG